MPSDAFLAARREHLLAIGRLDLIDPDELHKGDPPLPYRSWLDYHADHDLPESEQTQVVPAKRSRAAPRVHELPPGSLTPRRKPND